MEINHLHFMWISYSLIVTVSGLNVLYAKNIPYFLKRLFTFGKAHKNIKNQKSVAVWLEVPKRWFSHFYVFASIYIPYIMISVCCKYFFNVETPFLIVLLDYFASPYRQATVNSESVVIVSVLLSLQVIRRCYECFFVSIYSDAKMNVFHYIVGLTFYFGAGLSLIHDAPGFENTEKNMNASYITGDWFTWQHYVGAAIFVAAFLLQFQTNIQFASLRKKGKSVTTDHYMPSGGGFEYISCPHYFAEIVMYLAVCLIFKGRSYTWWLLCLWIVTNQVITGLMSHQWYLQKFEKYPVKRKAVIPFLL
ncbi:polyprenol reductase-like [Uloborus diversus]|uniref:polyprenol reductase-like n=1 Tax=Uloborus diversus TaxID=327109 RepID=UPI002409FAB0|nr:polyprenol reductase-like [Uloborus diversus]